MDKPKGQPGLLIAAAILYLLSVLLMLPPEPGQDAAGRGMAAGFGILLQFPLWLLLCIFLWRSLGRAQFPQALQAASAAAALAALAACVTAASYILEPGRGWMRATPILLPLLAVAFGMKARWPLPRAGGLAFAAAAVALAAPPAVVHAQWLADAPRRQAESRAILAENERQQLEQSEAFYGRLATLGPDSRLKDYLEFVAPPASDTEEATRKLRSARHRQVDTVAWLEGGGDFDEARIHEWNLESSPALCRSYSQALMRRLDRADYDNPDFAGPLADLGPQIPTMLWLHGQGCDLRAAAALYDQMLHDPARPAPPQPDVATALRRIRE